MENVHKNTYDNKIKLIDFVGFLLEDLYLYAYSIACSSSQLTRRFFEHIQLAGLLDAINEKFDDHPILKFAAFGAAACFSVPAVLFIAFAIVSVILTFAGFVLLEGILLAVGGLCLCVCLVSMVMVISFLTMSLGTFYLIATKLQIC